MMTRDARLVIATMAPTACRSLRTPQVRHRLFPELRAVGATPRDAARNLLNKMIGALDANAPYDWRRIELERAIEDVRDYLDDLARKGATAGPA